MEFKISKDDIEAAMLKDQNDWPKGKLYVNLHMSFDGYKPHFMDEGFKSGASVFSLYRMIPPGSLYYFYSVGNFQRMTPDAIHKLKTLTDGYNPIMFNEDKFIKIEDQSVDVPKLNYIDADMDAVFNQHHLSKSDLREWIVPPRPKSR